MNFRKLTRLLLWIPVLLSLNACKHDNLEISKENENFRNAADFVKNNYDLSLFSAAIERAGMTDELKGKGPFTMLAPSNNAFNQLGIQRPSDFDKMDKDSLKSMVQRHILDKRIFQADVPVNGVDIRFTTLAGTEVYATLAGYAPGNSAYPANDLYFNGALSIRKDVTLSNGSLHVLNKVMKFNPKSTVQQWLAARPQYRIFVSGLKKFGLWEKLSGAGPFTIFAPNNKAFEAQEITEASIAAMNPANYYGNRLFGCYIYSNKHYFISDVAAFGLMTGTSFFEDELDNDTWYRSMSYTPFNYPLNDLSYGIRLRTAKNYPFEEYEPAGGNLPALSDNLCENGLVHDMQGILLLPANAQKN